MTRSFAPVALLAALAALAPGAAVAQYPYGGGNGGGLGDEALTLFFEGQLANPRNTDNVVVASTAGGLRPLIPTWDDEFAGRAGLAFSWGENKVGWTIWGYETDVDFAGQGAFAFPIGPAIPISGAYIGDTGTQATMLTEIEARTADLYWARSHATSEAFEVEWSLGLRYARFEENSSGEYRDSSFRYLVFKSNEGEMVGARVAARATYRLSRFSFGGGIGLSLLDGELTASSGMQSVPATHPSTLAALTDDGRSGAIRDLDVIAAWHAADDVVKVWFGWEQSRWEDIASDLMRNLPGVGLELADRPTVVISAYKLGVAVRF